MTRTNLLSGTALPERKATLADLLAHNDTRSDLAPRTKRDRKSAINRVAEFCGADPVHVLLDIAGIRQALDAVRGVNRKTLANIQSAFFAAVADSPFDPGVIRNGRHCDLLPSWDELLASTSRWTRRGLLRLAHHCSGSGIRPEDVADGVTDEMMVRLNANCARRNQHRIHRRTVKLWNKLAHSRPELGLRSLTPPRSRASRTRIPLAAFPPSFLEDLNDYLERASGAKLFHGDKRLIKAVAPRTLDMRRDCIHGAASALAKSGTDVRSITALRDLVSLEAFESILNQLYAQAGQKARRYNNLVAFVLRQMARLWVECNEDHLTELKERASILPVEPFVMTEKNRERLRQFDNPEMLDALHALPHRIWLEARSAECPSLSTLAKAHAAVWIAISLYMPMRPHNTAGLIFDRHLQLRAHGVSTLHIPADETKNHVQIDFNVPPLIARLLAQYREWLERIYLNRKASFVFPKVDGEPKKYPALRANVVKSLDEYEDIAFNPHAFRHLAAKVILDEEPGAYELVRQLLAHKSTTAVLRLYTGFETCRAGLHHQRLIEQKLSRGRSSKRKGGQEYRLSRRDT